MKLSLNSRYSTSLLIWDIVKLLLALIVIGFGVFLRNETGTAGILTIIAIPAILYFIFKISDIYHMITYK